jgi:hypothetical protein
MTIELVFNESFDNVQEAVKASIAEAGFAVVPTPLAGAEIKAKMGFWMGKKGNDLLATVLPFLFKVQSVTAIISAYQDGTTGLTLREAGTYGGNLVSGVADSVTGGSWITSGIASVAAGEADTDRKQAALGKLLQDIDVKLREKLGAKIAYEGPPRPDAVQVPA